MDRTVRLAVVCLSFTALAACGGGDDADTTGSASAPAGETTAAAPASGDVVDVKGTEKLVFEPTRLEAKVGEAFRGRLVQSGSIPHNIEIKDLGVKGADTMTTKDGESKEFTFTADKAGDFKYVCTIHPATMTGTVHVA